MKRSGLIRVFQYLKAKDFLLLIIASILDKILALIPKRVFILRNELENFLDKGYKVSIKGDEYLISNSNKFFLRKNSSDSLVYNQIFTSNEYYNVIQLIKEAAIPIERIIDAGANIGLTTIYFKNIFPESKVICIEPDNQNFIQLQKNIRLNNLKHVEVLHAGIWSKQDFLEIDYSYGDGREWARTLKEVNSGKGSIPVFEISDILNAHKWQKVDFLKIDIEGAEEEIFQNSSNVAFLENVKVIAIEIHDSFKCGHVILQHLLKYHFDVHFSGELMIGIKNS